MPRRSTVSTSREVGAEGEDAFIAGLVIHRRHCAYPALIYAFNIVALAHRGLTGFVEIRSTLEPRYAAEMSFTSLCVVALALLALAAFVYRLVTRRRARQDHAEVEPPLSGPRFETTLGELRDLREALRPVAADVTARSAVSARLRHPDAQPFSN